MSALDVPKGDITALSLERLSLGLAGIYKNVRLNRDPLFKWLQIANDISILAEEIRRGESRRDDALARWLKILTRLLEFLGHLQLPETRHDDPFTRSLKESLKRSSFTGTLRRAEMREGPSRWILAKFPGVCAKCGEAPCHCVVEPWVFEERRDRPSPFRPYKECVAKARRKLADRGKSEWPAGFTIESMLEFFQRLYRNSYYAQDPWKTVMHLVEESGEASVELVRLHTLLLIEGTWKRSRFRSLTKGALSVVKDEVESAIGRIVETGGGKEAFRRETERSLVDLERALRGDALRAAQQLAGDQFKEEVADMMSWLAAVYCQLTRPRPGVKDVPIKKRLNDLFADHHYVQKKTGGWCLACPWCASSRCGDSCLVKNLLVHELSEKALAL